MNIRERWDSLQPSERKTLSMAGLVAGLLLIYLLIIDPYQSSYARVEMSVESQRKTLAWMEEAAREVAQLKRSSPQKKGRGNQSLLSLVDSSAKAKGMGDALKEIQPEGKAVQVKLEQVAFDTLLDWLDTLGSQYSITIDGLVVEDQDAPGRVNARVVLKEGA